MLNSCARLVRLSRTAADTWSRCVSSCSAWYCATTAFSTCSSGCELGCAAQCETRNQTAAQLPAGAKLTAVACFMCAKASPGKHRAPQNSSQSSGRTSLPMDGSTRSSQSVPRFCAGGKSRVDTSAQQPAEGHRPKLAEACCKSPRVLNPAVLCRHTACMQAGAHPEDLGQLLHIRLGQHTQRDVHHLQICTAQHAQQETDCRSLHSCTPAAGCSTGRTCCAATARAAPLGMQRFAMRTCIAER